MKNGFILILVLIFSLSNIGSFASQDTSDGYTIYSDGIIIFDSNNVTEAQTLFDNSITNYDDVIFYGSSWTVLVEITNWQNNGDVQIGEGAMLTFSDIDLNGTMKIIDQSQVTIDNGFVKKIAAENNIIVDIIDSRVNTIEKMTPVGISQFTLTNSIVDFIDVQYKPSDSFTVSGLNFTGSVEGLNFTMDELSSFGTAKVYIFNYGLDHTVNEITGLPDITYRIYLSSFTDDIELLVQDMTLGTINGPSELIGLKNLTMNNIRLTADEDVYQNTILTLDNVNGTIDNLRNLAETNVDLKDTDLEISNSFFWDLTLSSRRDHYYDLGLIEFNNTEVTNDFLLYNLQTVKLFNSDFKGDVYKMSLALGPVSIWNSSSTFSNMHHTYITLDTSSSIGTEIYDFFVPEGITFIVDGDTIFNINAKNATIIANNAIIETTSFDVFVEFTAYSTEIRSMRVGDYSNISFYDSIFAGGISYNFERSNVYFENTFANITIITYNTNITVKDSYIYRIWIIGLSSFTPSSIYFDNCTLMVFDISITTANTYNWIFIDSYIDSWGGFNNAANPILSLYMENTEIRWDYQWAWDQVYNLTLIDTILGAVFFEDLVLTYYEDKIIIDWTPFETTRWGSSEIGDMSVYRRERTVDTEWSDWTFISNTTSESFVDNNIVKGIIYDYRVYNYYDQGFSYYKMTEYEFLLYPAIESLVLNVIDHSERDIEHGMKGIFTLTYEVLHPNNNTIINILQDATIQYEVSFAGEIITTVTNSSGGFLQLEFDNAGDYTIRLRVSSEKVQIWSDWIEVDFTINEIVHSTTSLSDTSVPTTEEPGVFGFQFIYSIIAFMAIVPLLYRRNKI